MTSSAGRPDHTLFCKAGCTAKHNELILRLAICPDNKRLVKGLASLKQSLYEALQEGWNPHSNVTDPLVEFQWPLVHWACVLGKDYALEWLFKMNFRANAVNDRTGETAVHQMLRRLYSVCQNEGISVHQTFNKFLHLLTLLTMHDSDVLFIPDIAHGNTALHACALLITSQEGATSELEYHEYCMTAILRRIAAHDTSSKASVQEALNCKNTSQKTPLHILAEKNIAVNIVRYLLRKFRNKIDLDVKDAKKRTALEIALQNNAYSIVKVLESADDHPVEIIPASSSEKQETIEIQDDECFPRENREGQSSQEEADLPSTEFPSMLPTSLHHACLQKETNTERRRLRSSSPQTSPSNERRGASTTASSGNNATDNHHTDPSTSSTPCSNEVTTECGRTHTVAMGMEGRVHPVAIDTDGHHVAMDTDERAQPVAIDTEGRVHPVAIDTEGRTHPVAMDTEGRSHPVAIDTEGRVHTVSIDNEGRVHAVTIQDQAASAGKSIHPYTFVLQDQSYGSDRTIKHNMSSPSGPSHVMSPTRNHSPGDSSESSERDPLQNGPARPNVAAQTSGVPFASPSVSPGQSDVSEARGSFSPLIKLIQEEKDVVSLLQARLEDKRERLRHDIHEYGISINTKRTNESEGLDKLRDVLRERDELVKQDLEDARKREELLKELRKLDDSRTESRTRLVQIEKTITELKKATDSLRRDFAKRNECYSDMKRKLTEYDEALNEIAGSDDVRYAKREKLS